MNEDDRPILPPVRLPSEAELARDALSAPILARAAALARWSGDGIRVGAGGELLGEQLVSAAAHLGLTGDEAPAQAAEAWNLAVDIGLLEVDEDAEGEDVAESLPETAEEEAVATATPGADLKLLAAGSPADVLELWLDGLETVLADAAMPSFEDLLDNLGEGAGIDPDGLDLGDLEWDPEAEADFLDSALGNLYLLTAAEPDDGSRLIPLPVLAASLAVPEDAGEPTEEMLAEVSSVMMRLDEQFRILEPTGLVEFQPVDEALLREVDEGGEGDDLDEEDVTRYGLVRLTPLGQYGVRSRMQEAGVHAPVVGDLADRDATELLRILPDYPETAAQAELAHWLEGRELVPAVRELLAAARGDDPRAPRRRLLCQQGLSLVDATAEPALREVLDDTELGGLARVWLAERGAADVPPPGEEMVFWLTVDTFAAQLENQTDPVASAELQELMQGLVDQHSGFFDRVWRVAHPATADVLDAMGRLHPDRSVAKAARRAAYQARSRS